MSTERSAVIPPTVWEHIARIGTERRFEDGDVLLHHGATGRSCYAIHSGMVLVTATSTQGATLVLGRRESGALVGELAALEGAPRSATVTAKVEVTTFMLTSEQLHGLLRDHPDWAIALLQHLAGRIRSLSERFALRSEDLRRRVAETLVTNLEESGDPVFRSSRQELAGWVGATREAVTRVLQEMRGDGAIALERGAVSVVDLSMLRSF